MSLLNSALHIGRSAILSYQSALQVVGSNVSSAASPDYTRLSPNLAPVQGQLGGDGLQPGAGVALDGIQRNIDEALEGRIRLAIGTQTLASRQQESLAQIGTLFDDPAGTGLSAPLSGFFSAFDDLQNRPEDGAVRDLAITRGAQLADALRGVRQGLAALGEDLDQQIADAAKSIDELTQRIADLNTEITTSEAGVQSQATGLRDQRDALLRELSTLVDVTVREQPNGAINVYAGSEALVQGNVARRLVAVQESDGEVLRTSIRFADTNGQIEARGGRLAGLVVSRDQQAYARMATIDELAAALIHEVNSIHADGQGLVGFSSLTGSQHVASIDAALDSRAAALSSPVRNGSFFITVSDQETGTPVAYRIDVDVGSHEAATTLESLAADINSQVAGVTASITSDGRITFTADEGATFTFGHDGEQARADTSGVLAALGVNAFYSGTSARDIQVNETISARPSLLAASSTFLSGDGFNAGRVASLGTAASDQLDGASLTEFYTSVAASVAVAGSSADDSVRVADAVASSLQMQKESISGVNLDEEAISLVKYERAFQGAARYVSVVDDLLNQLISLIR